MRKSIHQRLCLGVQPVHLPRNVGWIESLDRFSKALVSQGIEIAHGRPKPEKRCKVSRIRVKRPILRLLFPEDTLDLIDFLYLINGFFHAIVELLRFDRDRLAFCSAFIAQENEPAVAANSAFLQVASTERIESKHTIWQQLQLVLKCVLFPLQLVLKLLCQLLEIAACINFVVLNLGWPSAHSPRGSSDPTRHDYAEFAEAFEPLDRISSYCVKF